MVRHPLPFYRGGDNCSLDIPIQYLKRKKIDIFIDNLNRNMSYQLQMQCLPSFDKLTDNGIKIEDALVKRGMLKLSKAPIFPTPITITIPTTTMESQNFG